MAGRIIITGGAGFLGSNLAAALNRRGIDDLLIVDHLGDSTKWQNLARVRFEDYLDKSKFLERVLKRNIPRPEALFHFGACSSTTERNADYLMENNYRYTRYLCEWAAGSQVRFIYASSAATYGDGSLGFSDTDDVTARLRPLNMYGYSKQLFDLWAMRTGLLGRIAGLKFFNVYGPGEDHKGEMCSAVRKAFFQARERGEVALFKSYRTGLADGEQTRDFIHVDDAVTVALFFFDRREISGLFNCGSGLDRSWMDLAKSVFRALHPEPRIRFIEMPEGLRGSYQYRTRADLTKLRNAGFAPAFRSLEDGVRDYVDRYLIHQ
jgi:ADP-L-glycero-D-manno-heptose 6-epimerase